MTMTPEQIKKHKERFMDSFMNARAGYRLTLDGFGRNESRYAHYMLCGYLLCAEDMEAELQQENAMLRQKIEDVANEGIRQVEKMAALMHKTIDNMTDMASWIKP